MSQELALNIRKCFNQLEFILSKVNLTKVKLYKIESLNFIWRFYFILYNIIL